MSEFYSRALVLDNNGRGEADGEVRLFTEGYGKVVLRAKSIRKISSKSGAHLQPLRFVRVRWTESRKIDGKLVLLDALWDDRMASYHTHERHDLMPLIRLLDQICMEFQPEPRIWRLLETVFVKRYDHRQTGRAALSFLGFHPEHEQCVQCGAKSVSAFISDNARFACGACASQLSADEIILEI